MSRLQIPFMSVQLVDETCAPSLCSSLHRYESVDISPGSAGRYGCGYRCCDCTFGEEGLEGTGRESRPQTRPDGLLCQHEQASAFYGCRPDQSGVIEERAPLDACLGGR